MSITSTIKTPQQFVITRTTAIIVMGISTVAMVIPQAAYANNDKGNPSSSDDDEDCASDELPASINGKIRCIGQGECYSEDFEFNGKEKEVEHCNFMMSTE